MQKALAAVVARVILSNDIWRSCSLKNNMFCATVITAVTAVQVVRVTDLIAMQHTMNSQLYINLKKLTGLLNRYAKQI